MKILNKKILSTFILVSLFSPYCYAEGIKGHVQKDTTNSREYDKNIFTGEVEKIEKKDTIELTVSQVLSSGITQEGDEFFAEVSSDVESDKGIILPVGTIVHGTVEVIQNPKISDETAM